MATKFGAKRGIMGNRQLKILDGERDFGCGFAKLCEIVPKSGRLEANLSKLKRVAADF